jgi:hypothetical protein
MSRRQFFLSVWPLPIQGLKLWSYQCSGYISTPHALDLVPYIGKFVLVYLDDILVMSRTPKEHLQQLRLVLDLLSKYKLYAKLSKCEFGKTTLKFLGHVVSAGSVAADSDKIQDLRDWPLPTSRAQLSSGLNFLGLAKYVRRFISHYSEIAAPLTRLISDNLPFSLSAWQAAEYQAFQNLKQVLMNRPLLAPPDCSQPFTLQSDASNTGFGATFCWEVELWLT